MKFIEKIDPAKVLKVVGVGLAIAGTLVSNKIASNDQKALKGELKEELLKELTSDKN